LWDGGAKLFLFVADGKSGKSQGLWLGRFRPETGKTFLRWQLVLHRNEMCRDDVLCHPGVQGLAR